MGVNERDVDAVDRHLVLASDALMVDMQKAVLALVSTADGGTIRTVSSRLYKRATDPRSPLTAQNDAAGYHRGQRECAKGGDWTSAAGDVATAAAPLSRVPIDVGGILCATAPRLLLV